MGHAADPGNHMPPSQANLLIAVSIITLTVAMLEPAGAAPDPSGIPPHPFGR